MKALLIYLGWLGLLMLGTLRWPAVAVGGVLCANGLFQWAQSSVQIVVARPMMTNYLIGVALVLGLIVMFFQQKPLLRRYPAAGWLVLILLAWCLATALWSVEPAYTLEALTGRALYIFVLVVLTPLLIADARDMRVAMNTLVILGSIIVTALLLTSDFSNRGVQALDPTRGQALNPLGIASMGAYVAAAATLLNFRGFGRVLQVGRWGLVAMAMALVIFTQSRGQFLALMIVLVAFLPMSRRMRNAWGFVGAAAGVVVVAALGVWLVNAFGQAGRWEFAEMTRDFYASRIEPAETVLRYWLESNPLRWLLGLGANASYEVIGSYPHMVAAEVLAELGLIGFGIFTALIVVSVRSTLRVAKLVRDEPIQRGVVAAVSALFWLNFILSFKQGSLMQSLDLMLFAIVLGRYELAVRDAHAHAAAVADAEPIIPEVSRVIEIQPVRR